MALHGTVFKLNWEKMGKDLHLIFAVHCHLSTINCWVFGRTWENFEFLDFALGRSTPINEIKHPLSLRYLIHPLETLCRELFLYYFSFFSDGSPNVHCALASFELVLCVTPEAHDHSQHWKVFVQSSSRFLLCPKSFFLFLSRSLWSLFQNL